MGVTSNWCHPQGHHARRPPTTVLSSPDRWLGWDCRAPASRLDCFHWNFLKWSAKCIKTYEDAQDQHHFTCTHRKFLFLVRKVYLAYYRDFVSSMQVEIYPSQLQIQPLLLLTELQDFTQEATQAAHWCSRRFRVACTGYIERASYGNKTRFQFGCGQWDHRFARKVIWFGTGEEQFRYQLPGQITLNQEEWCLRGSFYMLIWIWIIFPLHEPISVPI